MNHNKTKKAKKKIVPELPDIKEIKFPDIKLPKIEDLKLPKLPELPKIEDMELPGLPGRGALVLGLLKNLMPGLKITQKKQSSWIQAFNRMRAAEISRIIYLSSDEKHCRRAIEKAVKAMEK